MYYAIIKQTADSAEYTGVVYNEMTNPTIIAHKEQECFIEPMDQMLEPVNKKEMAEYEMKMVQQKMEKAMSINGDGGTDPVEDPDIPDIPMPVYAPVEKVNAVNAVIFYIREEKKKYNISNFTYTHSVEGECTFSASSDAINAVYTMCTGLADGDPIPTQHGQWKGYLADGTSKMIDFTVSEFKAMATSFFNRNDANFHNEESHATAVRNMITDDTASITDILNYDYSTGWNGTTTQSADIWF